MSDARIKYIINSVLFGKEKEMNNLELEPLNKTNDVNGSALYNSQNTSTSAKPMQGRKSGV